MLFVLERARKTHWYLAIRGKLLAYANKTTLWTNSTDRKLFSVLIGRGWPHSVPLGVEMALLGRFYQRFADHAVEIGRRVIFMDTGSLPAEDEVSTY